MQRLFTAGLDIAVSVAPVSTMTLAGNPAATVNMDANANRRAISPLIYGTNPAPTARTWPC